MNIITRDFGEIQIDPQEIIDFVQPIFGFEHLTKYVLLQDDDIGEHFVWLQSIEDQKVCFILTNPGLVIDKYPTIGSQVIGQLLEKFSIHQPKYWSIAVITKAFKDATINLKSPILIDSVRKLGLQVILDEDYPIRYPLLTEERGEYKMLVLSRKIGQSLIINDDIEIIITEISGDKVKLGIVAPKEVKVLRKELYQTMAVNKVSAFGATTTEIRALLKELKLDR